MIRRAAAALLAALISLAVLASVASGAAPNPAVELAALACASQGNCSAIGTYDDALGDSQGVLLTERDGVWGRGVEAQLPAGASTTPLRGANGGGLVDIACPAAGDCTAVGRYTDSGSIDHGLLLTESHGKWARGIRLQLPSNAITPAKPKGVVDDLGLAAVSCSSVGNCVAVGNYETKAEVWAALIVTETHGKWQRGIEAPLPADAPVAGQSAVLLSLTCLPAGTCTAVGNYVDAAGHEQGLLVAGSGEDWTAAPAPAAPADAGSDPNIVPSSVSCADAGDCAAVGTYVNPLENSLGLLFSEAGGTWEGGAGAVLPANAAPASTVGDQTAVLSSVSCPQAGQCSAVGWYFDNDENGQGLLLDQDNGVWQPGIEVTLPANAVLGLEKQSAGLDWVSCASAGNCLATGVYTDAEYNSQGLLLSEVGGVWHAALESPLPANAGNIQYAAASQSACTGVGDCAVIGQYDDARGDVLGYTISESGGSWGRAVEVVLPAANAAEAKLSLAALLKPTGKTATLAHIRSAGGLAYEYSAAEAGTAAVSWYGREHGNAVVVGSGRVRATAAGSFKLELRLTRNGRALLAAAKRVRITATASFTARAKQPVQHTAGTFTLR